MPTIMPVSSLRSYTEVLEGVAPGTPVFLTKNGQGRYAILDMDDYDRLAAENRLLSELQSGHTSGEQEGWIASEHVKKHFVERAGDGL
ncbi:MAG: type II toxin-antitoxin system prevent-host-death family antitoxin [Atopobium sp.]|uniref:type II toxin-antitoxin system prevent-host-death family antitoxin n=1 Tax=Atopobium sp. TaxID=1872650 RepID=UPI002A8245CF|nr:type II toxin-antitoxin system prevent-host-death family antitoxin [Atopobium sp.]MDY4523378.1 type II toxin-antitoxin system prevent-host-death family antitoxin [Atopobium sp.]